MRVRDRSVTLLGGRDWVYLLSLLVPLLAYEIALKVINLVSEYPASGVWAALRLLRSDLLFDLGYALLCIGLLAASRGMLRRVVLVLFHASAILVVLVTTCAYHYFRSTGTTLDFPMVAYYLTKPGEAEGAVSSAVSVGAWLILGATLLYALLGPMLLTRGLVRLSSTGHVPNRPPCADARKTSGGGRSLGLSLIHI